MKVICVASPKGWHVAARIVRAKAPEVGDQCTVTAQYKCVCGKHDVYDFEEFSKLSAFDARCFAIIPENDADDINEVEKDAIIPFPLFQ